MTELKKNGEGVRVDLRILYKLNNIFYIVISIRSELFSFD